MTFTSSGQLLPLLVGMTLLCCCSSFCWADQCIYSVQVNHTSGANVWILGKDGQLRTEGDKQDLQPHVPYAGARVAVNDKYIFFSTVASILVYLKPTYGHLMQLQASISFCPASPFEVVGDTVYFFCLNQGFFIQSCHFNGTHCPLNPNPIYTQTLKVLLLKKVHPSPSLSLPPPPAPQKAENLNLIKLKDNTGQLFAYGKTGLTIGLQLIKLNIDTGDFTVIATDDINTVHGFDIDPHNGLFPHLKVHVSWSETKC